MSRKDLTPEQLDLERWKDRQRYLQQRKAINAFRASKGLPQLPPSYMGVTHGTVAHRLLWRLHTEGPKTSTELGGGTSFGQQVFSTQILRLLEKDLITQAGHTYSITAEGEKLLQELSDRW